MSTATPPWRVAAPTQYSNNASPAYIPVHARRSLNRQPPSTTVYQTTPNAQTKSASPEAANAKKVEWPLPVRQYVQRSFVPEAAIPDIAREEMEIKLKQIITDAAESNNLMNVNWEALPLPQEMIRTERSKSATAKQVSQDESKKIYSPKRKSTDISATRDDNTATIPPWRKTNNRNDFEDRISYSNQTDKRRRIDDSSSKISSKLKNSLESRKRRFEDSLSPYQPTPSGYPSHHDGMKSQADNGPVIGRCEKLEKNYFRLTSAPNPDTVRPLPVLRKTLDLLKRKWRQENNYGYVCDQFKSMRQDLTVQHIKNEFTVNVYEIHARIALEKGDLGEYNQCQTQLQALYALALGGHPMEFKAYRILYFIYTRNQTAINSALADLTPAERIDTAVKHALDVRSALALGNFHRFFQLYLDTPNMGAYLMDMFVDRERLSALACICKAYKPDVNIRFITEELGFESDEQSARFVLERIPENLLQEKPDGVKLLTGKTGSIFEQAKTEAHRVIDIKGQI